MATTSTGAAEAEKKTPLDPYALVASTENLYDLDVTDCIRTINRKYGNPLLSRGAFGDVAIAIHVVEETETNGSSTSSRCWQMAVVKTIAQATTIVSTGVGVDEWDQRQQRQHAKRILSREVFHEIMALKLLSSHPNIVTFHGLLLSDTATEPIAAAPGGISMAFEYCPLDLHMLLEKNKTVLPMSICRTMCLDILNALRHCHAHGILHRDVKPGNFLISSHGHLVLCDFGLAKPCPSFASTTKNADATNNDTLPAIYSEATTGSKGLCTLWYRSPEVLLGGSACHPSIDMYSAGLVMAELFTGHVLFPGNSVLDQLGRIFALLGTPTDTRWPEGRQLPDYGKVVFHAKSPQSLLLAMPRISESRGLHDLMTKLLCLDPGKRLTADRALQHEWLSSSLLLPPPPTSHDRVATEAIPTNLRAPRVLFSAPDATDKTLTVARNAALKIASARRTFLQTSPEKVAERTLMEACQALTGSDNALDLK